MRRPTTALVLACALAGATGLTAHAAPPPAEREYIVVLEEGTNAKGKADEHSRAHGAQVKHVYQAAMKGYSGRMSEQERERVAADPDVAWVEPVRQVRATAQSLPTGIDRVNADASPTAAIDGADQRTDADVAVIDTGVDSSHPDLDVVGGKNCTLPMLPPEDGNGHGTHVAGTIGAVDNGDGVVGVAPGARIWAVKVLNDAGVGTTADVVCGIDYVAANAGTIDVANMSLGGAGSDDGQCGRASGDSEHSAICRAVSAGVTFAVAAGNDSADAANSTPAAYDEVITVSALADFNGRPGGGAPATCRQDEDDTFADFSNFGADVDLIAPGVCITSTWPNGGYNTISGTSMATPHVAGGAALHKATNPGASPEQVKNALQRAGTKDWTWPSQDPDGTQESLLDVTGF
ncbi:S8 family peptidase [Saccharopolyspora griseoalba]|uniref:S8 family peptidase n=1 Tax=Saccharopolyspora griseoalba TaxID=1431848 RepID=A0ABW2LU63_9PSEU